MGPYPSVNLLGFSSQRRKTLEILSFGPRLWLPGSQSLLVNLKTFLSFRFQTFMRSSNLWTTPLTPLMILASFVCLTGLYPIIRSAKETQLGLCYMTRALWVHLRKFLSIFSICNKLLIQLFGISFHLLSKNLSLVCHSSSANSIRIHAQIF